MGVIVPASAKDPNREPPARKGKALLSRMHRWLVSNPGVARLLNYHAERERVQEYWRSPTDSWNRPERYLDERASRQFLVQLVSKYLPDNSRILEIGCNAGANMDHLFRAGFRDLAGIEINPEAVRLLTESFPTMAASVEIYNATVEDVIRGIPSQSFDLIYTMAVLEHLHTESEWVFREMVRVTRRFILPIEDERSSGWGHFRRDYAEVFEGLGMSQVGLADCGGIEGLGERFTARVFAKDERAV